MITGKDFIFTGLQSWDIAIGSNAKDIALEISKLNRVLYVNPPLDVKTYYSSDNSKPTAYRRSVIKEKQPFLRQINKNMWVLDYPFTVWPVNVLPDGFIFDFINKSNNRKMYAFVRSIAAELEFKDYLLFIDNDIYKSFYAKDYLSPVFSIYYRRDNFTSAYWKAHAPRLEPLLCAKSDLVISNSLQLADAVKPYNKNTYDVGQGIDLANYRTDITYKVPDDIQHIPSPIIGYVGWITGRRLDADLLYDVASQRPEYSFLFVGKEDDVFKSHKLHNLSNVFFTGEKKPDEIIAYIAHFDVCLNPQIINEITIGNYPRKIDEYLAMGKPTVATSTPTMQYLFKDYVYLPTNREEYLQSIDSSLQEVDDHRLKEQRIQYAHSHSWENSAKKIYSHIKP